MMEQFNISRRSFLSRCAMTAAATGLPLWFLECRLAAADAVKPFSSPNDRPGIGLIGCGAMGGWDALNSQHFGDVMAVCDVDDAYAGQAEQRFKKDGKSPAKYSDFRKLLERDDIQVIVQATPDHWHTLVNLAAAKAKKDIYGEKPLTLTIDEGRHVVEAVRETRLSFKRECSSAAD